MQPGPVPNGDSKRVFRGGGGCLMPVGLALLAFGLLMALSPFRPGPLRIPHQGPPAMFLATIGTLLAIVGTVAALGRSVLVLDRTRGAAVKTWYLLLPFKRRHWPLAELEAVQLDYQAGDSDSAASCPVSLRFRSGAPALAVTAGRDFGQALALAKDLCRFLQLPLEDRSGGEVQTYEVQHLDEPYLARAKRLGQVPRPVPPPQPLRSEIRNEGGSVVLGIPSPLVKRKAWTVVRVGQGQVRVDGHCAGGRTVHLAIPFGELRNVSRCTVHSLIQGARARAGQPPEPAQPGVEQRIAAAAEHFLEALGGGSITLSSTAHCLQFGLGLPEPELEHLCGVLAQAIQAGN